MRALPEANEAIPRYLVEYRCFNPPFDLYQILPVTMYPYDIGTRQPAVSPNGKYIIKLHFNGCDRKVAIDDRLPSSKTSRFLYVVDRNDASLFWPALIEKAFLKARGGYDLPGSNSGTDLWMLTGWIPEQLFLQR